MFKTKNLSARSIYETNDFICMDVVTIPDNQYLIQILVSKHSKKPYYDDEAIDFFVKTSVGRITRQTIKSEIEAGVKKYFEIREKILYETIA